MVSDLDMPVAIEAVETVREGDGLAMSSRNSYLQAAERKIASQLYQVLLDVKTIVEAGETDFRGVEDVARQQLAEAGLDPDYVSIRRQLDIGPPAAGDTRLVVLAAVRAGTTRLIDNLKISTT